MAWGSYDFYEKECKESLRAAAARRIRRVRVCTVQWGHLDDLDVCSYETTVTGDQLTAPGGTRERLTTHRREAPYRRLSRLARIFSGISSAS